jgi:hypothetical protein
VTVALVDDRILGAVLRGASPHPLRDFDLATTGYWYVRLCQAVLRGTDRPGVLSKPFSDLPERLQDRGLAMVTRLPEGIDLISLRNLAPLMGRLRQHHALNVLGMEALAAAVHLPAEVFLSAPSPRLQAALDEERKRWHLIG